MGVGRGCRSPPSWIFIHGTDIVDWGLIVLFFGLFSVTPPPWKRLSSAVFRSFLLFFSLSFRCPRPWKFLCWRPCKLHLYNVLCTRCQHGSKIKFRLFFVTKNPCTPCLWTRLLSGRDPDSLRTYNRWDFRQETKTEMVCLIFMKVKRPST